MFVVRPVNAQVQHLCGNDTIILHMHNYQYGSRQWEVSDDSIKWTIIPEAIDTIYKFYPDGDKYYRAGITFALCPIIYSDIFKVSMAVNANAGMDRMVSLSEIILSGNKPDGCTGLWSIINGTGGSFDDATNPISKFTGQFGQNYKLVWTLTNICGTSTDTVNITMIQNVYCNNIVYVDSTDIILSDSAQMAQGYYKIKFSSPVPTVTDSSVLIFLTMDQLLLKVISVTSNADTAFIYTDQGSLQDFIINGVIDFSPFNYQVDTLSKKNWNTLPTRQEILNNNYENGQILYYKRNTSEIFAIQKNKKNTKGFYDDPTLSLTINPTEIYNANNVKLTISGNIDFTPNLISYIDVQWMHLDTMIIKLDNAELHYTIVPELEITGSYNLINFDKEWLLYHQDVLVSIAGVPVWLSADVYVKTLFTIDVSGTVTATLTYDYRRNYTAGIYYGQHDQTFTTFSSSSNPIRLVTPEISGTASLNSELKLGPKFSLKLYNTLTGYIEFYALKANFDACINNQLDWNASIDLSSELVLGGYGKILGWVFWNDSKSIPFGWFNDKFPYTIQKESGDMQTGINGQNLAQPVKVRVKSDWGIPLPFVKVYFEPLNGSVQNTTVITDAHGYAQTNWTPDNSTGSQYLEAYVNDCNGDIINNKTTFTCYVGTPTYCEQSTMTVAVAVNTSNNTIKPVVTGGLTPYEYSTDGINYQTIVPVNTLISGTIYKYYVKDATGCIKVKSYTYSLDPCANANLIVNIAIDNQLMNIVVTPQGGTPPYQYAYITPSIYSSNNTYTFSSPGVYTVYVKDVNNCLTNSTITIISTPTCNCPPTVVDVDGNTYNTVTIGTQCWMRENLKVTHYRNGDPIPNVTDGTAWSNLTTGAYCNYDNDANNSTTYGRLYNWYAVGDIRNIAPTGWHVATDAEWTTLTTYLGGEEVAGGKLKEAGYMHWYSPNTGATNETGFTALPGGDREFGGAFGDIGYDGAWWSSTENYTPFFAWYRIVGSIFSNVYRACYYQEGGISVRCVRDGSIQGNTATVTTDAIIDITPTTATSGGNVTSDGGSPVTARGICWNTSPNPTTANSFTTDGSGTGTFVSNLTGLTANTPYYVRAYATNGVGTAYGNEVSFTATPNCGTVTDADGNTYNTVTIGTQCWMVENLKTTHYRNGDPIPNVTDGTAWSNLTTGAYCNYDNDANNSTTYGRLYNWYAVGDSRNIAPTGWHVATDAEWTTLTDYLGGEDVAGGKLKEAGYTHWQSPNTDATNETGFTALPGGFRCDIFGYVGYYGDWWSATEGSITSSAWNRDIDFDNSGVHQGNAMEAFGFSVRCVRD